MEIANGLVILSPENQQFKYDVTPAEALILYELHRINANGTPLGEFYIQNGVAQTVDVEAKPAQEEERDLLTGKVKPPRDAVPAKTHDRTQQEEVSRLKKKYTGNITKSGVSQTAFVATFGSAVGVRLPETFAEIEQIVGHTFLKAEQAPKEPTEIAARRVELLGKLRADLCVIAVDECQLKVHSQDTKEQIVQAIIEAEQKRKEAV